MTAQSGVSRQKLAVPQSPLQVSRCARQRTSDPSQHGRREPLLPRQEFVHDGEKLLRVFLVWIVSRSRNRHDLHLRQCPLQVFLSFSRNDRASAAQYINDGSLDFPDEPPQFGGHESVTYGGITFPNDAAIDARLRSVVSVGSKDFVGRARIACLQIRQESFFGGRSRLIC